MKAHPFDEWVGRTYPGPQPAGTRETALTAWNAAVHKACDRLSVAKDQFVYDRQYESAVVVRDLIPTVSQLSRIVD